MNALLQVRDATVRYGPTLALDAATFDAHAGRLTAIVGPNGAGKSTALNAIMGFVPLAGGTVDVGGDTGAGRLERIVFVPQRGEIDLDFPITVREVVAQGRYRHRGWFGRLSAADRERVDAAMEATGTTGLARRQIGALSGGQRQRVFLARALAQDGDVVLLDEPFAGVDASTEAALLDVLRGLRDAGRAVVVVHHDLSTVATWFDDVVLLRTRVVATGPVDEVLTRARLESAYGGPLGLLAAVG